jgi:hypothetical protein
LGTYFFFGHPVAAHLHTSNITLRALSTNASIFTSDFLIFRLDRLHQLIEDFHMHRLLTIVGVIIVATGCTVPLKPEGVTPMISKYEVNDFIEYKYSGSFRKDPIKLTEEIIEKNGNQLVILVHLKSSSEERTWKQFVTDTPENQKNNKVDRLIEVLPGNKELILANTKNADLFRQYRGTYIIPDGPPQNMKTDTVELSVCGKKFMTMRTRGQQRVNGGNYSFENYESEDFLWNHIASKYTSGEKNFYKVEVVRCSR